MARRKVCFVITARPSYARIKKALKAVQESPDLELQIVVMGSMLLDRYGTPAKVLQQDGFPISAGIHMLLEGETPLTSAKSTAMGLMELAPVLERLQPDAVVTIGDRFETLATAIAASYINICLVHVQGGEVTGSIDEKVRHAVTKLANLHFTATQAARERVVKLGEDPSTVFFTGCPSIDLAAEVLRNPEIDFDPIKLYGGVGDPIDFSREYVVVMQHPVTTEYMSARQQVYETLRAVGGLGIPTLWFWPNADPGAGETAKGVRIFRETGKTVNIHFFKNMAPEHFLKVLYNSRCLIGNSSVAIREGAFLGFPAVNIGTRQSGRERGRNVIDVGHDWEEILVSVQRQLGNGRYPQDAIYGDGKAGPRIAALLAEVPLTIEKRLAY